MKQPEKAFTQEQAKRIRQMIMFQSPSIQNEIKNRGGKISLNGAITSGLKLARQTKEGMTKSELMALAEEEMQNLLAQTKQPNQ